MIIVLFGLCLVPGCRFRPSTTPPPPIEIKTAPPVASAPVSTPPAEPTSLPKLPDTEAPSPGSPPLKSSAPKRIQSDVLIVGGSLGGVAAAIRAADMGMRVCLIEPSRWLGGQMTYQGEPTPDENHWTGTVGSTASYQMFAQKVRAYYRTRYRVSPDIDRRKPFNPGKCWVSRLGMEPRVALAILREMMACYPNLTVHLNTRAVRAEVQKDRIVQIRAEGPGGAPLILRATMILDATDLGDLLPLANVEHVVGAESRAQTGEPDAPPEAHPDWIQSITFPFALERRPANENHTIPRPPDYDELKAAQKYSRTDGGVDAMFGHRGLWNYRRIIAAENFLRPAFPYDISIINTASNDYHGGVLPTGSAEADAQTLEKARRASLGFIYWLQTECPRDDDKKRRGYPEFRPATEVFDTPDAIAPLPYIRESRRIKAIKTVVEQDVVIRDDHRKLWQPGPRGAYYADSCGIGYYLLDIHAGMANKEGLYLQTRPFQIPMGALIPIRVKNLLAASKNIGTTHLTNGAYRHHPIEWSVGEAAGALAAFCIRRKVEPRNVRANLPLRHAYQETLVRAGMPVTWWADLPIKHPAFQAAQILGVRKIWPSGSRLEFSPNAPLTLPEAQAIEKNLGSKILWPAFPMTHAAAARWLLSTLMQPPKTPAALPQKSLAPEKRADETEDAVVPDGEEESKQETGQQAGNKRE